MAYNSRLGLFHSGINGPAAHLFAGPPQSANYPPQPVAAQPVACSNTLNPSPRPTTLLKTMQSTGPRRARMDLSDLQRQARQAFERERQVRSQIRPLDLTRKLFTGCPLVDRH